VVTTAPPNRPWLLSTRPIPASRLQEILHDGSLAAITCAAATYARNTRTGIPDEVNACVSADPGPGAGADNGVPSTGPANTSTCGFPPTGVTGVFGGTSSAGNAPRRVCTGPVNPSNHAWLGFTEDVPAGGSGGDSAATAPTSRLLARTKGRPNASAFPAGEPSRQGIRTNRLNASPRAMIRP
jgi:hypothetical protein